MAHTPDDPTKAQVWVTKGLDDLDFEFYFPQGPKGDPGGFTTGTLLGANNLNTITIPGLYRTTSGANTTLANNYPVNNNGGILVVTEMATGYVVQTYESLNGTAQSGSVTYKRQLANSVWTSWKAYHSTRVDQTAGRVIYQWDDVNARDQMIYGDTGWRDIMSLLAPAMVAAALAPKFAIRRIGNRVLLAMRASPAAATIGTARNNGMTLLNPIPVGFVTGNNHGYVMTGSGCVDTPFKCIIQGGALSTLNQFMIFGNSSAVWASGEVAMIAAEWTTDDPWPTTLPGTTITNPSV